MNLLGTMMDTFAIRKKTASELIDLSIKIDAEKMNPGSLKNEHDDLSTIASVVVALLFEPSTKVVGEALCNSINDLIVKMNEETVELERKDKSILQTRTEGKHGKYMIQTTATGYRFSLLAPNGEIIASSELYSSLESCTKGIMSIQKNAGAAIANIEGAASNSVPNPKYEVYVGSDGLFRFRLKAKNGAIIAVSSGYKSKKTCEQSIEKLKKYAITNEVEKN